MLVQMVDHWHDELLEGGSSNGAAAAVFHALDCAVILMVVQN